MATTTTTTDLFAEAVFGAMATIVDQAAALDALVDDLKPAYRCELCDTTDVDDPENVGGREEGRYYSGCCNEKIVEID